MKQILMIATGGTIASAEDGHGLSPAQAVDPVAAALAQRAQGKPIREKD